MPHGKYMRGTRLDYIISFGVVFVLFLVITLAVDPIRSFAYERDERRSDDVREIMSSIIELSVNHDAKYEALVKRLEGREGNRFMLGGGESCAGSWGRYCSDEQVPDDCLPPEEIFSAEAAIPIDPKDNEFGTFATGYYLSIDEGLLRVGACSAQTQPLFLETLVR